MQHVSGCHGEHSARNVDADLCGNGKEHTCTPNYKINRLAKVIQRTCIYGNPGWVADDT